jgi:hypothetical protein
LLEKTAGRFTFRAAMGLPSGVRDTELAVAGSRLRVSVLSMGNVRTTSLREIWNSGMRQQMLALNDAGRLNEVELCRNCMDYDL